MRNLLTFCLLYLVSACAVESGSEPTNPGTTTLTILVNDVSESTEHVHFSPEAFRQLLHFDALNGGTQLATLLINSTGNKQMPWISNLLKVDTTVLSGNRYQRARIDKENQVRSSQLNGTLSNWVDTLKSKILLPKTDRYSDVNGAFYHIVHLAETYHTRKYRVRIIIFSDLLQDTPNHEPLRPITLPSDVEIFLIGTSPHVDLQQVFPNNQVTLTPVFDTQLFTQNTY